MLCAVQPAGHGRLQLPRPGAGPHRPELDRFFCTALQAVGDPGQTTDALWQLVQATGEASYRCMELLDAANTGAFGDPEPVQVP